MTSCSILFIVREFQIKTIIKYIFPHKIEKRNIDNIT